MSRTTLRQYFLLLLFIPVLLVSCSDNKTSTAVTIGREGNIQEIQIPQEMDSAIAFAATELQSYIKKITGHRLPIKISSGENHKKNSIELAINKDTALKWDGFKIEVYDQGIRLVSAEPRGLLYAAYALLEDAGCSFFYPGKMEEIVPGSSLVSFAHSSKVINPILEHRGLVPYGLQESSIEQGKNFIDWMAKNRFNYILVSEDRPSDSDGPAHGSVWKETTKELLPELKKRSFVIKMSEHCTPVFFPRSLYTEHPEWFALNNGKRVLGEPPYSGQMCYSNKQAIEYYGNALARYAKEHPEFHSIGTWPLDGGEYCECENCKDPQTVFNSVMRVAEKIREVRPDIIVEHLAYKVQTWQPPAMEQIPKNISILWCPDAGDKEDLVKQWINKTSRQAGVYQFEYYLGDNYRSRANLWLRPQYASGIAPHARELGYKGVVSLYLPMQNWWRSSFNSWFFARTSWTDRPDVTEGIRKYCSDYYGNKAEDANEIFNMIFNDLQEEPFSYEANPNAEQLKKIQATSDLIINRLDKSIEGVTDSVLLARFKRIKTYVEYFRLHSEAHTTHKKPGLDKMISYSEQHPDQDMVLMYPGYIRWRNREFFTGK